MELMYPIAIIICLVLGIVLFFIRFNKKKKYTVGKKVANTKYIKETEYYKKKVRTYHILSTTMGILSVICILITGVLIARPVTVQTKNEEKYNRDILLSLDISTSQNEVNKEFIQKFRKIIPNIEGDRIGIVIYNTAPVVFCPLTDDYDYIYECFDTIEEQIKLADQYGGLAVPATYEVDGETVPTLWYGGVSTNSEERGSSLVGDGMAGTVFSFPNIKTDKDRTRIMIFVTDNAVAGKEEISLDEACDICKEHNINVYAYCPTTEMNPYATETGIASYKRSIEEHAGGKFYTGNLDRMSSSIVDEIKETKTSAIKTSKKTYVTDYPEILVVSIVLIFLILIIIEKRIKL